MTATPPPPDAANPRFAAPPPAPITEPVRRAGFSAVWIIPTVAALLGLWLLGRHYSAKGPEIVVRFETAEGLIAGKTPVLCRSVPIGTVTDIGLANDLTGVEITISLTRQASHLVADDSQIWIVRPRYSAAGISGLNTLVTGSFVELQPGVSKKKRRQFTGLENPPATPPGVPGLRFRLTAAQAGGLGPGATIIYKGIAVGKIEARVFHPETGEIEFSAFIEDAYAQLVDEHTRFYNSGGLDLKVGADGIQLRSGTLESLISSGVTFTEPPGNVPAARRLPDGRAFTLYGSLGDATKAEFNPSVPYLLLFSGSVRGLSPDAAVEFRGIRVGSVEGASFRYLPGDGERRVPVLIKLDPSLLLDQTGGEVGNMRSLVASSVTQGLRASLKTGSLLTGQLYVDLDFQKDAPLAAVTQAGGYDVLPTTTSSGLEDLQVKAGALLDKFKALPIETTVESLNQTLAEAKVAVAHVEKITSELAGSKDIGATLHNVRGASEKLNATVTDLGAKFSQVGENLTQATDTVKRQPWRLIWPSTKKYDEPASATPAPATKKSSAPKKTAARRAP